MASLRLFIFTIYCINSILGSKKCNLTDNACMTRAANVAYPIFMKGVENVLEPSDPLTLDSIDADSTDIKYKLQNAKFIGMNDCSVTTLILKESDRTFQYQMECQHIELNAGYTLLGNLDGIAADGTGPLKMTADKIIFELVGIYDKSVSQDNKDHVSIKSYNLEVAAKGNVIYELKNLKENSDTIQKYFNDNWQNKELLQPIHTFIRLFFDKVNKFLTLIPTDELFADLS